MRNLLLRFISDTSGATAIEYGLIATFIAIACIAAMTTIGSRLQSSFSNVSAKL